MNPYINECGDKIWYKEGTMILHREDGPTIEYTDGAKYWFIDGKIHREDGPAVENVNGIKYWFLYGEEIQVSSQEEFLRLIKLKAFW